MGRLKQPLLFLLARCNRNELIRQIEWLKEENEILRKRVVKQRISLDQQVRLLLRNRGGIYRPSFDKVLRKAGIRVKKPPFTAPNLQVHVEWFIQSIQQEAVDHFIVFGEEHFDHLVSQYIEHYHTERPHHANGNVPLIKGWSDGARDSLNSDAIVCRTRLGELPRHYERRAA